MRKFFAIVMLSLIILGVNAQNASQPGQKHKVYCELMMEWGTGHVKVMLDMGHKADNNRYKGYATIFQNGKRRKFGSKIEVVNYMCHHGWTLHSVNVTNAGSRVVDAIHFYLFEKEVTDDSQIEEGLELGEGD